MIRSWVAARCNPYAGPVPAIPPEMIAATSRTYTEACQTITGQGFVPDLSHATPLERIRANLAPWFTVPATGPTPALLPQYRRTT